MHHVGKTLGVKREAGAANVSVVAGESDSFLLHVQDTRRNEQWLVDGGALLSILPPTRQQRRLGPSGAQLRAANGSEIKCYGNVSRTITIGQTDFEFTFTIADVKNRIIGADFLAHFYLAPNHRDALLINLQDFSTLPATHARGATSSPVNFVSTADDPFFKLLDEYPDIQTPTFTIKEPKHGVRHHIPTDSPPVQSRARRLDPEKLAVAKAELEKLVDLGIAYRGKSEWSSPLLVTTKPCGGWRVCGDYRRLNAMTTDDRYPVRTLQDFTSELQGKKFFSKVDLMKGYHQIPVAEPDIKKTAVITPFGLFIFPRTPFGLKNAGQDFQRLMDEILGDIPRVYVYIDDILIASETLEQHLEDLEAVFKTLSANGLVIQRSKCVLGKPSLEFLGYTVDENGISPLPEKVAVIRATTPPTSIKELQRFLGMVGYYRKFIPNAATHLYHLFEALKGKPKTLEWTSDCQKSFEATKEALAKASMLFHPRKGASLALTTDASNSAVGGVLEQRGPKGWEPLAFYSSKLEPHQRTWPPYDRELLGAFKAVRHFRHILEGRPFTLFTDHQSLVPSMRKKTDPQTIRQTYQLACISEFTTDIRYLQGKANVVADALSRPNEESLDVNGVSQAETLTPDQPGSVTISSCAPHTHSSTSSSTPLEASASPTPSSTLDASVASSTLSSTSGDAAARRHAAEEDLSCVVNAITTFGINWNEIAAQQALDPDFRRIRDDARSGLQFKRIDIGQTSLIVDISNGPARPFIPLAFRKPIFNAIHGLGHPGVERTRQAVRAKVVWPSMNEDVARWARECIPCQQAKVIRHTVPPIGDFAVPDKRFEHVHLDLVTLPLSNGCRHLLTAVDRFTRWPAAIPLSDISAQSVIDAFVSGWIQNYGVPSTVTSDRGSQFSSAIFQQLTRIWGIETILTTPYHPEANGMVERFHRRLKESLIALGADEPDKWYWRLPMALLAIRTTVKPDIGASPSDLVYGEGLSVPGEVLPKVPSTDEQLERQRQSALSNLRLEVARLQPTETSAHRRPLVHLPDDLHNCTHVFVRRGGVQPSLASPYSGPYRVVTRNNFNFRIAIPGRANETVSISRVKPAYAAIDDAEAAAPPSPPPPGRRPRPPRAATQGEEAPEHLPPRRQPQQPRRVRQPHPQPPQNPPTARPRDPPAPPPPPAPADPPRRRRARSPVEQSRPPPQSPPPVPPAHTDWFLPGASPPRHPASPPPPQRVRPQAQNAPPEPRRRLFSGSRATGRSATTRPPTRVPMEAFAPPAPRQPPSQQEDAADAPRAPQRRFFSSAGPSSFSRRRPDVSALINAIHEHLGDNTPHSDFPTPPSAQ